MESSPCDPNVEQERHHNAEVTAPSDDIVIDKIAPNPASDFDDNKVVQDNPSDISPQENVLRVATNLSISSYFAAESNAEDPFSLVCAETPPHNSVAPEFELTEGFTKSVTPKPISDSESLSRLRPRDAWLSLKRAHKGTQEPIQPEIKPFLTTSLVTSITRDPYRSALVFYLGEESAVDVIRRVPVLEQIPPTSEGLKQLISNGWHRGAIELTHRILSMHGHQADGKGAALTPFTAQIWLTRLALLVRIREYTLAEEELATFHDMDAPNVYFDHYPDLYPGRCGSIIPFSLRLLHAELPFYLNRTGESLDRLYAMLAVINQIKENLHKGLFEDGSGVQPEQSYIESSLNLWTGREIRVLSSCLSIYLAELDYLSAIETVHQLESACSANPPLIRGLAAVLGRIYLQVGDLQTAQSYFSQAVSVSEINRHPQLTVQMHFQDALLCIGRGDYEAAKKLLQRVLELDPINVAAANNLAVCYVYTGQLSPAIHLLDTLTTTGLSVWQPHTDQYQTTGLRQPPPPPHHQQQRCFCLHDALVSNLSLLYEIESNRATTKKVRLLERLASLPGEPVHLSSIKLRMD